MLYNKFRQTLAHTHRHAHTGTRTHTQHTVAYTCLCLPYNKAYKAYNGARVPQTRIHTSATHAHMLALCVCGEVFAGGAEEGQGLRKRRAESLSYTQRHLQLLEQTQCLFGCLRCELTWRAKNELAKHVTKVTQHNGAAHTHRLANRAAEAAYLSTPLEQHKKKKQVQKLCQTIRKQDTLTQRKRKESLQRICMLSSYIYTRIIYM